MNIIIDSVAQPKSKFVQLIRRTFLKISKILQNVHFKKSGPQKHFSKKFFFGNLSP